MDLTTGGRRRTAAACGLAAAAWALLVTLVGGFLDPEYRHASQYISELGALGAPHGPLVSLGGFLPVGVLVLLFLGFGWPTLARCAAAAAECVLFAGVGGACS